MSDNTEIQLLKAELGHLKERVKHYESSHSEFIKSVRDESRRRIKALEENSADLEARIRVGKGVFIGLFASLGFFGITLFDRVKDFLLKTLN